REHSWQRDDEFRFLVEAGSVGNEAEFLLLDQGLQTNVSFGVTRWMVLGYEGKPVDSRKAIIVRSAELPGRLALALMKCFEHRDGFLAGVPLHVRFDICKSQC